MVALRIFKRLFASSFAKTIMCILRFQTLFLFSSNFQRIYLRLRLFLIIPRLTYSSMSSFEDHRDRSEDLHTKRARRECDTQQTDAHRLNFAVWQTHLQ